MSVDFARPLRMTDGGKFYQFERVTLSALRCDCPAFYRCSSLTMRLSTTMTRITLYTKAGCHLCEKARDALLRVARDYPLTIDIVDITSDNELYERYWDVIPVVEIEGGPTFVSRISEFRLRKVLEARR
jgi:glutaredoxin